MNWNEYGSFIVEETKNLLAIDSPSGMTKKAAEHVMARFEALGYAPQMTRKDGVLVCLGGVDKENGLLLEAHMDTLGGMVCQIKANGRLKITPIGGLRAENVETENCRVVTKFDGVIEGTAQLVNASTHDKLSVGILLGYARYLKEERITPERAVYVHITSFEEVGHGGSASVPAGVTEAISVDMGCVGEGLTCDERMVSICAKDSGGPYNYEVVRGLIAAAEKMGAPYAVDVYPRYGSDVEATLRAGYDLRHGLIGSGVYASHGYERSHIEGALATLKTLAGYVK